MECPDCYGSIPGLQSNDPGSGKCSDCHGDGTNHTPLSGWGEKMLGDLLFDDFDSECPTCEGTGDCQTCGGTGEVDD